MECHFGDARNELLRLSNESVQTVITDPPYNIGFDYGKVSDSLPQAEYLQLIDDVLSICYDKCKPNASFFLIHYPESISTMWNSLTKRWKFHQWITWVYPQNIGHSTKRFTRASRTVLWLCKDSPKFYPDRCTQPYKNPTDKRIQALISSGKTGTALYDWWEINLCKNVSKDHRGYSNQIPEELLRRLILSTTDEQDIVVDPFAGTFSTPRTAEKYNRIGWGCDLNEETKRFVSSEPKSTSSRQP